jgi:hypothetical protein
MTRIDWICADFAMAPAKSGPATEVAGNASKARLRGLVER